MPVAAVRDPHHVGDVMLIRRTWVRRSAFPRRFRLRRECSQPSRSVTGGEQRQTVANRSDWWQLNDNGWEAGIRTNSFAILRHRLLIVANRFYLRQLRIECLCHRQPWLAAVCRQCRRDVTRNDN